MRLSIKTRQQETTFVQLAATWTAADELPTIDGAWLFDHFYPIFTDAEGPCLEGWTTLAALATMTRRLRIGVMVSGNTYRHPAVLANMAATVDVVSRGRLEIGIGAGWNEEEHRAYGIELPPLGVRFDRLEEACAVLDGLLRRSQTDFRGAHYQLTKARCEPKPVQQPRPPLVIGGRGEKRTLRIAAQYADQWNYPSGPTADFRRKIEVLHNHCGAVGRDPDEIEISVQIDASGTPSNVADEARRYVDAGAQHVILNLPPPFHPEDLEPLVAAVTGS